MADLVTLPGCRTIHVAELRQRADLLITHGKHEEGSLLHALLDGFLDAQGFGPVGEIEREKKDLEEELSNAECRADEAEDRVEELLKGVEKAVNHLNRALGGFAKSRPDVVREEIAAALAELAGTGL